MPKRSSPCCPTCGKSSILYGLTAAEVSEGDSYRLRIRNLVAQFQLEGYETYQRDMEVACAVAQIMASEGERVHLKAILATHMERIIAAKLAYKDERKAAIK